jgi:hypothetical protein
MSTWKADDLDSIGTAEELQLASEREDGTFRQPITMWVVRVAEELYVRSVNGPSAAWYRGALEHRRAEISAGGVHAIVELVDAPDGLNNSIDEEYRRKYDHYSENTLGRITSENARSTTLRFASCWKI